MKKIMFSALMALGFICGAYAAADTQYKVYDLSISLKTTKAAGIAKTACGEDYVYRTKSVRKLAGVIGGCGCLTAAGDTTAKSFVIYLWDATTKKQITDFTYNTVLFQRIGKNGREVEQIVKIVVNDPEGEKFVIDLVGLGTYTPSKAGAKYDTVSIVGNVTGTVDAPYDVIGDDCVYCGVTEESVQSAAFKVCEGACSVSVEQEVTPAYGSYVFKYNRSKSQNCEKKGINKKTLALPAYVEL